MELLACGNQRQAVLLWLEPQACLVALRTATRLGVEMNCPVDDRGVPTSTLNRVQAFHACIRVDVGL